MRRIVMAAALAFTVAAWADDTTTSEHTTEVKTGKNKVSRKSVSKKTNNPGGLGNKTTDETKTESSVEVKDNGETEATAEKTISHDAPGIQNDTKKSMKRTVVRDANGKVIEDKAETK